MSFRETPPDRRRRRRSSSSSNYGRLEKTDSLASLKKDISSLIESSFGVDESNSSFNQGVQDLVNKMKQVDMNARSPLTRGALRRQSSAFEFARPSFGLFHNHHNAGLAHRRQSSAFEIGKKDKTIYETMDRDVTRASLRRKSSSVKDLIRRIESKKSLKKHNQDELVPNDPPPPEPQVPPQAPPQLEEDTESWVDATEFFKDPHPPSISMEHNSCKRSSIIRIRNENRGKVSKSVETFTRPKNPITNPPTVVNNNRRLSARMGVSSTVPPPQFTASRRTTLTGIRTTTSTKRATPGRRPPNNHIKKENIYANVSRSSSISSNNGERKKTRRNNSDKRTNRYKNRRADRRHLTIGYEGEQIPRSPLKERQNVVTVQRSKSAQAPLASKPQQKKNNRRNRNNENVARSHSMKQTSSDLIPHSLKETVYDCQTPTRVKRNLSDRVVTPNKGGLRNDALPFIKSAIKNNTPYHHTPSYKLVMTTPVRKSPRLAAKLY